MRSHTDGGATGILVEPTMLLVGDGILLRMGVVEVGWRILETTVLTCMEKGYTRGTSPIPRNVFVGKHTVGDVTGGTITVVLGGGAGFVSVG